MISPQQALAEVHKAATHLGQVKCDPACPLQAQPYPTGPGTCHRCRASGILFDLARDLEKAIREGAR